LGYSTETLRATVRVDSSSTEHELKFQKATAGDARFEAKIGIKKHSKLYVTVSSDKTAIDTVEIRAPTDPDGTRIDSSAKSVRVESTFSDYNLVLLKYGPGIRIKTIVLD